MVNPSYPCDYYNLYEEEEDSGKSKVSLQFAPPVQHPAGAPPVSTEEEFAPVQQKVRLYILLRGCVQYTK